MTVKEEAHKIIDKLPEKTTLNDIAYTLFIISKVQQGDKEIEEGRGVSHEEAVKIMKSWQK